MTEAKPHILVIDDDDRLRALLMKFLREQGFMVSASADTASAKRLLTCFTFDLITLDVMMPGETGVDFLAGLKKPLTTPVLMLSAMGDAHQRIAGLEVGAEDYLAKPFEPKELVLRINAILRRTRVSPEKDRTIIFGPYRFDPATSQLKRDNIIVALTTNEAALLKLLSETPGVPIDRETLTRLMPGVSSERSVDVQITRLRKKIEDAEGKPAYLQTVRGAGYVLYANRRAL